MKAGRRAPVDGSALARFGRRTLGIIWGFGAASRSRLPAIATTS
jgi:hypothetical protein